jgi:hypothetical protein
MANQCPGRHGVSPDTHSTTVEERPFRATLAIRICGLQPRRAFKHPAPAVWGNGVVGFCG